MTATQQLHKFIGLRNTVTDGKSWHYLLFYEWDDAYPNKDKHQKRHDFDNLSSLLSDSKISHIIYSTKHGFHLVCFTPLNPVKWGYWIDYLWNEYRQYYSGETIRLSRKHNEKQELIAIDREHYCIPNLYNIYAKRFDFPELPHDYNDGRFRYKLVFEKYWSPNQ